MKSMTCLMIILVSVVMTSQRPEDSNDLQSLSKIGFSDQDHTLEKPSKVLNINPQVGLPNPPARNLIIPHIFHLKGKKMGRSGLIVKRSTTQSTKTPSTEDETAKYPKNIPSFQDYLRMVALENSTQSENKPKSKRSKKTREKPNKDENSGADDKESPQSRQKEKNDDDDETEEDESETDRTALNAGRIADPKTENPVATLQNMDKNLRQQYEALLALITGQNRFMIPQPHVHKHTTICHSLGRMRRCSPVDPGLSLTPYNHLINKVRYQSQLIKTISSGIIMRPQYY